VSTSYFDLSSQERKEALDAAAGASGRLSHLLEKDVWVVWVLNQLFTATFADHLVFKGGTSLSKVHKAIRRFSEDVDITWDIRDILSDRVRTAEGSALPRSPSQANKWTDALRERLPSALSERVVPLFQAAADRHALRVDQDGDKVNVQYKPVSEGRPYTEPRVQLEFGARATGEPWIEHHVVSDAAEYVPDVTFPEATVRAMRAERTFWEKATAAHVYCIQGRFRGSSHFARHWYDLVQLDECGVADRALGDGALATSVAEHKKLFFAEKGRDGEKINYLDAVNGHLQLVPADSVALKTLEDDYADMIDAGYLPEDADGFERLISKCRSLAAKANDRS
jgi:hypothetical protein